MTGWKMQWKEKKKITLKGKKNKKRKKKKVGSRIFDTEEKNVAFYERRFQHGHLIIVDKELKKKRSGQNGKYKK